MQRDYGGRYTTNLIEDIRAPERAMQAAGAHDGFTNYRPFEEVGSSMGLGGVRGGVAAVRLPVNLRAEAEPLRVSRPKTFAPRYTYVPPHGSPALAWYDTPVDLAIRANRMTDQLREYGYTVVYFLKRGAKVTAASLAAAMILVIVRPARAAADFVGRTIRAKKYTMQEGLRRHYQLSRAAKLKSAVVALAILAGMVVFAAVLPPSETPKRSPGAGQTETTASNPAVSSPKTPSDQPATGATQAEAPESSAPPSAPLIRDVWPPQTGGSGSTAAPNWSTSSPGASQEQTGGIGGGDYTGSITQPEASAPEPAPVAPEQEPSEPAPTPTEPTEPTDPLPLEPPDTDILPLTMTVPETDVEVLDMQVLETEETQVKVP